MPKSSLQLPPSVSPHLARCIGVVQIVGLAVQSSRESFFGFHTKSGAYIRALGIFRLAKLDRFFGYFIHLIFEVRPGHGLHNAARFSSIVKLSDVAAVFRASNGFQ